MKRTLFATVPALLSVAAAAEIQDITTTVLPAAGSSFNCDANIVGKTESVENPWVNLTWNNLTAPNFSKDFKNAVTLQSPGSHFIIADGRTSQSSAYKSFTFDNGNGTIGLTGRTSALGQDVLYANVVSVSSLLGMFSVADVSALKLTLTGLNSNNADAWWGVYKMDASGTLTQISNIKTGDLRQSVVGSDDFTKEVTLSADQIAGLQATDSLVAMFRVANSSGLTLSIKDLKYVATVPEPATATLSLLALAGLALRRRR